jgi:hypothetical protein
VFVIWSFDWSGVGLRKEARVISGINPTLTPLGVRSFPSGTLRPVELDVSTQWMPGPLAPRGALAPSEHGTEWALQARGQRAPRAIGAHCGRPATLTSSFSVHAQD